MAGKLRLIDLSMVFNSDSFRFQLLRKVTMGNTRAAGTFPLTYQPVFSIARREDNMAFFSAVLDKIKFYGRQKYNYLKRRRDLEGSSGVTEKRKLRLLVR